MPLHRYYFQISWISCVLKARLLCLDKKKKTVLSLNRQSKLWPFSPQPLNTLYGADSEACLIRASACLMWRRWGNTRGQSMKRHLSDNHTLHNKYRLLQHMALNLIFRTWLANILLSGIAHNSPLDLSETWTPYIWNGFLSAFLYFDSFNPLSEPSQSSVPCEV